MEEVLTWEEYFMSIALVSAKRSKDPRTKVGACIVNDQNRIVGIGYNGMPNNCIDAVFPWETDRIDLDNKYLYVVHAELNAILNSSKCLNGCTIYTTLFPCNECSKAIIQVGIKKVVYLREECKKNVSVVASKRMLKNANIVCLKYIGRKSSINICFD